MPPTEIIESSGKSLIQEFYENQTIFITGSTGFLGKLLLEKLLRCCRGVKHIYLLVRQKKGVDEEKRFKDMFEADAFEVLKREYPNFQEKVSIVHGDCKQPNLGLGQSDRDVLIKEVTTIFHVAATIKFNQDIRTATYINVRATGDLAKMAKEMTKLKALVYISTAYSNCIRKDIDEKVYEPSIEGKHLIRIVEALNDSMLEQITPILLGKHPNTYAFTKNVAEHVIYSESKTLPLAIVRPSIVLPTWRDPVSGWTDNIFGAIGVALGAALGLIRTVRIDPSMKADLMPADLVVNGMLAAGWDVGGRRENDGDATVYNCVSSNRNPITWRDYNDMLEKNGLQYPTMRSVWHYSFRFTPGLIWFTVSAFFLHTLPAYVVDLVLIVIGKQPQLVKGYQKIGKFLEVISYFGLRQWEWRDDNVQKLAEKMSEEDKKMFLIDVKGLDWEEMTLAMIRGGRKYVLKESEDTIPAARRRFLYFKLAHYTIVSVCVYLLYKLVFFVLGLLF